MHRGVDGKMEKENYHAAESKGGQYLDQKG